MFQVACDDGDTSSIIEAVRNAAGTGKLGDGKIFITGKNWNFIYLLDI